MNSRGKLHEWTGACFTIAVLNAPYCTATMEPRTSSKLMRVGDSWVRVQMCANETIVSVSLYPRPFRPCDRCGMADLVDWMLIAFGVRRRSLQGSSITCINAGMVLCKRRGCGKLPPLSRGIPTDNCGYPHYQQLLQLHNSHVTSAAITLTEIHQITQIEVQSIPRLRASEPSIYEETSCVDQASLTIDSSRNPRTDYGLC